jgi:pimeloyl-ACP methyl ester carboxylesterase
LSDSFQVALTNCQAAVDHKIMLALGYTKYIAQGGDWGSMIVRLLGIHYPTHCVGVHVNMIFAQPPSLFRSPLQLLYLPIWAMLQGADSAFKRMLWWRSEESGYLEIQGTKPQTLSYALMDSPIGMLAWFRDKVHHLVDDDFMLEDEEIVTWAMLYLIPGTAGHAQIYKNAKEEKMFQSFEKDLTSRIITKDVDFGYSMFPKGMLSSCLYGFVEPQAEMTRCSLCPKMVGSGFCGEQYCTLEGA